MEKIFDAKLDPDIESPSHETHFNTLPSTCFFGGGLRKFSPSVVYGNACSNLNYSKVITASPVRLPVLLECNVRCREVPKYFQNTFIFRRVRPLKTRQSKQVEFTRPRIGSATSSTACRRPTSSAHGNMQSHLAVEIPNSVVRFAEMAAAHCCASRMWFV